MFGTMKQRPYNLHAILVHEGDSENGHYYAFIYDRKTFSWYRFNDYKVSVETEDKVFEESFGNPLTKSSAYGLIYINQEISQNIEQTNFSEYIHSLES